MNHSSRANPQDLQIPAFAVALIRLFERFSAMTYREPNGTQSIGYGHNIQAGERFVAPITPSQALELLKADILPRCQAIQEVVKVEVSEEEYCALISLCYNIGVHAFQTSELVALLNAGQRQQAADQFLQWVHASGRVLPALVERREIERDLFLG